MNAARMLWALLPVLLAPGAMAQYWKSLDGGVPDSPGTVYVIYGDSVWDRLLLGSTIKWIVHGTDTLLIRGTAQWNGTTWDSLPSPVEPCDGPGNGCGGGVFEFTRYNGELYVNGNFGFYTPDSLVNESFARWNEDSTRWEALECLSPFMNGILTFVPVPPQDTMYFTGYRGSLCGYPESCVFQYDGSAFYPFAPFDDLPYYSGNYVGYVFKYLEQYYMTGLLTVDTVDVEFYGLMRYTGSAWEPVPGFETAAPIKDVLIHDGRLYLCGYFFTANGAPGNMVTMYDGTQWSDLGGGLLYDLPSSGYGVALDLLEWNGDIYVAGQFNYAGGVPAENVARWNGSQWCGMGGHSITSGGDIGVAGSVTVWRDTLFMCGGFVTMDGDTMNNVAKWLGVVENCSEPIAVQEVEEPLVIHANLLDPEGVWSVVLTTDLEDAVLVDALGRTVVGLAQTNRRDLRVDLRANAPGIYAVICSDGENSTAIKLVKW